MDAARDPALRDDLTGAFNRRYLRELFETRWAGWLRERQKVAILLLDLDLFKEVNDRYGHVVGDGVLRVAVERLQEALRTSDPLIRYGGDEFVVVLPGLGAEEARELAVRARRLVTAAPWRHPESGRPLGIPVSFSIGVAAAPDDGKMADSVLVAADRRLYEDKRERRERRLARQRRLRLLVGVLGLAALVGVGDWMLRRVETRAEPEPAVEEVVPAVAEDSPEVEALRLEVERLGQALAAEKAASAENQDSQRRIEELEKLLEQARSRVAQAGGTPTPSAAGPPVSAEAPAQPVVRPLEGVASPTPAERAATPASAPAAPAEPRAAPVFTQPKLVRHEAPIYPYLARRQRVEGSITLELAIDAQGRVARVRQTSPALGYGLDDAARRAARSAIYEPATRDGVAVAGIATLTIRFRLDDSDER